MKIVVIGGNGRTGRALIARLLRRDAEIVSLGRRTPQRLPEKVRFIRTETTQAVADAVSDATHIANCASIFLTKALYVNPSSRLQRLVTIGSTRAFTTFEDPQAQAIREITAEFERSGLPGLVIHASMIYGGGDQNVSRIADYLTKTPVVPLPNGGRSLIQPIHYEDVMAAVEAGLFAPEAPGKAIIVAGPRAMTLRTLIETIGQGIGRRVRVIPFPATLLYAGAAMTRMLPRLPSISRAQVDRMLEDRAFDISDMTARLGVIPREFAVDASILENGSESQSMRPPEKRRPGTDRK